MPTKPGGYFLQDGTKVPSVTTICGRFKESGGLINWAWKLGKEGRDYREVRDIAADAGTLAHAAADAWIHGRENPLDTTEKGEILDKAQTAYGAFLEWTEQTQLVVTDTELPLISERYCFGGTFDAILVKGKRALGDWKTSNALYPEYLLQIAAYAKLWDENYPWEPITGGFHLLRFDKTHGDFHHHWWAELDRAWEAFLLLRRLYDIEKELKQRIK